MRRASPTPVVLLMGLILVSGMATGAAFAPFGSNVKAVLQSGRNDTTDAGVFKNYYIYAEAGALVDPAPVFALQSTSTAGNVSTVVVYNETLLGLDPQAQSNMTVTVLSHPPLGTTIITSPSVIYANAQNQFVVNNLVLPVAGRYNIRFVVNCKTLNRSLTFNYTIPVNKQPQQVLVTQQPAGYNGSALSPEPQGQLADFLNSPVRTYTPNISLVVIAGPDGGVPEWDCVVSPNFDGAIRFPNCSLSQPGTYTWALRAHLTDGTFITSSFNILTVERAVPVGIVPITQIKGVTRAVFFAVPRYRIVDQLGWSIDKRTNLTLSIGVNNPTVTYQGQDTLAQFVGITSVTQTGFDFVFPGLSIDLPGTFQIVATLYLSGEFLMQSSYTIQLGDLPTFTANVFQVNRQSNLTLYGFQPDTQPLFLVMSSDITCKTPASNVVQWAKATNIITQQLFNIYFTPFVAGSKMYLCLQLPSQTDYVPLLQRYLPAFDEPYPLNYFLTIVGVDTCVPLTSQQAFYYNAANWTTAVQGRRYGCNLSPPVQGTIPPCACPIIYFCGKFTNEVFTPPGLDIGMCQCCKAPVLALACSLSCGFLAGIYWFIYMYL